MAKIKIIKNDMVIVNTGNSKGVKGKVIKVYPKENTAMVEGVNLISKHTKPNAANQQGGLVKAEAPVHYSNVQLFNPTLNRGVRVKIQTSDAGVKNRVCAKSGEVIG